MNEETKEIGDIQDLEGRYADAFKVGQSAYKFVLEFGQYNPEKAATHFHTRMILGPDDARRVLEILIQSMRDYEDQFGRIIQSDE